MSLVNYPLVHYYFCHSPIIRDTLSFTSLSIPKDFFLSSVKQAPKVSPNLFCFSSTFSKYFHIFIKFLSDYESSSSYNDRDVWLVSTTVTKFPLHTHIAGRPIHPFPIFQRGPPMTMADSMLPAAPGSITGSAVGNTYER